MPRQRNSSSNPGNPDWAVPKPAPEASCGSAIAFIRSLLVTPEGACPSLAAAVWGELSA
jgi:hypothetical protein